MKIVIVGGGKVGYYLCKSLLEHGHEVHLVEQSLPRCEQIADELDLPVVNGDGTAIESLASAEAGQADALVAVTGQDEANLIACQLGRAEFGVKKTVARSNNPRNLEIMRLLGVDIPVSSTEMITNVIEQEVDSAGMRLLTNIHGKGAVCEVAIPEGAAVAGMRLHQVNLPPQCLVVSVVRQGDFFIPNGDSVLLTGDEIIAVTTNESRKPLLKILTALA
ncbi:MAG: TrkA family potassium uptake protein [Clostridiales bacterium]|nr:TrkA family potassium uptake protein [Clostridiales bacterium]